MDITEKQLLAAQLDILIRNMSDNYEEWKNRCGRGGWYNMDKEQIINFFKLYLIEAVKITAEIYNKQSKTVYET